MNNKQIIETLRDDAQYYNGLGKKYLSNSDIQVLINDPQSFGKEREDAKHFHEGRYFHQRILEPEKAAFTPFVDASTRNTNIYKDFLTEHGLSFCLLKKEIDNVEELVKAIQGNIVFFDTIYQKGNKFETPGIAEIKGLMWKGKNDIECPDIIIDLKTTSDIQKFRYNAKAYNYDSQAYIYGKIFGKPLVFYVVDKETKQLGIFTPSEPFLRSGEAKVEKAVEIYNTYFGPESTDDIDNFFINETI